MRTLLRVVGAIWTILGIMNIYGSPSFDMAHKSLIGPEFVILFNIVVFIGPGLLLAGVGSIIKKTEREKKCPFCAEKIKYEATKCRFCNAELNQ